MSSITRSADGVTRTVSYAYNSDGSGLSQVTDAAGGLTSFGYDAASNLSQITDAAGRVTQSPSASALSAAEQPLQPDLGVVAEHQQAEKPL